MECWKVGLLIIVNYFSFLASLSGGQVRSGIRGFCLDSCLYDGCWLLTLTSIGVLWVVGGLSPLGCWHRHPGVKTGVDHYDLQSLNIYILISSIILVLTLGSGWLIPLGLVIADCTWGCLMGLWWLMPNGIGVWTELIGSVVDRLCLLVFLSI